MLQVKTQVMPSSIEGLGLFADQDIPKGTIICRFDTNFDREFDTIDDLPEICQSFIRHFGYKSHNKWSLNADNARFLNHSIMPNISSSFDVDYDVAIKDIVKGEELTVNYFNYDEETHSKLFLFCPLFEYV